MAVSFQLLSLLLFFTSIHEAEYERLLLEFGNFWYCTAIVRDEPKCENVPLSSTFNLNNSRDTIHFFEDENECSKTKEYKIFMPTNFGIVLLFNRVALRPKSELYVYFGHIPQNKSIIRQYTSVNASSLAPLLVRHNKVLVRVTSDFHPGKNQYRAGVNFTFFRHPLKDIPEEVVLTEMEKEKDFENNWNSKHKYNCSLSSNIPQAIRCDMVKQCIGGEDEHNCSYRKPGCEEEWISYKDVCVSYRFSELASKRMSFSTLRGQRFCNEIGGVLASDPRKEFLNLIATIIRQSGYISASIGISKYSPVNSKVGHLYKLFWQWGGPEGVIAHDQTLIQRYGESWDCAMFQIYPIPHLRPTACDAFFHNFPDLPQGVFCTKGNALVTNTRKETVYSVNISQPSTFISKFKSKRCPDGSFVHTFLDCNKSTQLEMWPHEEYSALNFFKPILIPYTLNCNAGEFCYKDQDIGSNPTAQIDLGWCDMSTITDVQMCPETHFQCPDWYCIPIYMVNNGERDCLNGEDENIPAEFTCSGFYRCHEQGICLHSDYLCDNIKQCPLGDDEMFCNIQCPENCLCLGLTFKCNSTHGISTNRLDRIKLDVSGTPNISLTNLNAIKYLEFLNASFCMLNEFNIINMPYMQTLDLSFNNLSNVKSIQLNRLSSLRHLNLSHNPFLPILDSTFSVFIFRASVFLLESLRMTNIGIKVIEPDIFTDLSRLTFMDISSNDLQINTNILFGLNNLRYLKSDVRKLCCREFLPPGLEVKLECVAPEDELSSCTDLLRSENLRVALWIISLLAVVGNGGLLVHKLALERQIIASNCGILLSNLSLADFLMGVYMIIIGFADVIFKGQYVMKKDEWTQSKLCKLAGFIAFMASEMSVLAICLISLERTLSVRSLFKCHAQLTQKTYFISSVFAWMLSIALAIVPFLPLSAHWEFYSQNGICLPLPITRRAFDGETFAFMVFSVCNLVLFAMTGVCLAIMYHAVKSPTAIHTAKLSVELHEQQTVTRRFLSVIFTKFCCWFPVCLLGLLAHTGTLVSGEVNTWAAVFILPLNSALNPFLYTINVVLEQRDKERKEQVIRKMVTGIKKEIMHWPTEKRQKLFQHCVEANLMDISIIFRLQGIDDNTEEISTTAL